MRLQFRVWDKNNNKMLYNGFVLRHNNPSTEYYTKYNDWCLANNLDIPKVPEYDNYEAEPCEIPTEKQLNDIRQIMYDDTAIYELIDYSNFYGQEHYITMQCTGFHDKNNKLIWEGDLLEDSQGIIDTVINYYGHWTWNGQVITDFRDFDRYGDLIYNEVKSITIIDNGQEYNGVVAVGYQGDTWGLQTQKLNKVGTIFEDGAKYQLDWKHIFGGER